MKEEELEKWEKQVVGKTWGWNCLKRDGKSGVEELGGGLRKGPVKKRALQKKKIGLHSTRRERITVSREEGRRGQKKWERKQAPGQGSILLSTLDRNQQT